MVNVIQTPIYGIMFAMNDVAILGAVCGSDQEQTPQCQRP